MNRAFLSKPADRVITPRDFQRFLRECGWTSRVARQITTHGFHPPGKNILRVVQESFAKRAARDKFPTSDAAASAGAQPTAASDITSPVAGCEATAEQSAVVSCSAKSTVEISAGHERQPDGERAPSGPPLNHAAQN